MTLTIKQIETDKRDYMKEALAYLNTCFRTQEDMEQRIGVHLLDYVASVGASLDEPAPGDFIIYGAGLRAPQ